MIEYELKVEGVCIVSIELDCRLPRSISKLLDGDGVNESGFSLLSRSRMGTLKREKRTASQFSDASKTCIFAYL